MQLSCNSLKGGFILNSIFKQNIYILSIRKTSPYGLSYTQDRQKDRLKDSDLSRTIDWSVQPRNWSQIITTSVLHPQIFSVYPKLGNQREDLHRIIKARETGSEGMVYVTCLQGRKWWQITWFRIISFHLNSNHPIEDCIVTKTLRNSGMHVEGMVLLGW